MYLSIYISRVHVFYVRSKEVCFTILCRMPEMNFGFTDISNHTIMQYMRFVTIEILYLTLLLKNEMASFNLNIKSKVSFICRQLIQQIALRSDKESHLSALKLLSVDVAIVFANLIDNTIESCIQMPAAERWVSVQILYSHEILSISIITPSRPIQIIEGKIATTKLNPPLHGFGLRNVEDILEKYHAEYTLSCEDGQFIFTTNWLDTNN